MDNPCIFLLTESWASRCCDALNDLSESAGLRVEADVAAIFGLPGSGGDLFDSGRSIFLRLAANRCVEARGANAADVGMADHILVAPLPTWEDLIDGRLSPEWALMSGRVRLAKGSLRHLLGFMRFAEHFLRAARAVGRS